MELKKKIAALGGNVFEVTAITTGFQQKGSKNCRTSIMPQGNIEDPREDNFLNPNSSKILEGGEGKEHEIAEKPCKKR